MPNPRLERGSDDERLKHAPDPGPDPFQQFSAVELAGFVGHLLGALTKKQEAVLVLHYRDEQTFEEIGRRLHISTNCACRLHQRATAALEKRLGSMRIFKLRDLI